MSGPDMNTEETWNADTAPVEKRAHGERPHSHQLHGGAPEEGNPHAHDRHTVRSLKEVSWISECPHSTVPAMVFVGVRSFAWPYTDSHL